MDLYHSIHHNKTPVLYRQADYPLTDADIAKLKQQGINCLYILDECRDNYQAYLRSIVQQKSDVAIAIRASAVNAIVRDVLQITFAQKDTEVTVQQVQELADVTCDLVSHEDFATGDLFRVLHHDYATFTHSTNVGFYAATLAFHAGFRKEDLRQIVTGGLLHDVGKLEIPDKVLSKPGRLDPEEFEVIKTHSTIGFRILCQRKELSWPQLMMAYQHHERIDGRGYPVGITGNDIHPWAKICSVVDVYEAVTSFRPYRKPMSTAQAIDILDRDSGTAFDPELVRCWKAIIQNGSGV